MRNNFRYNKDGGIGVTNGDKNTKKSADEIIAGLTKVTNQPLDKSKAITLVTPQAISIPTEKIIQMKNELSAFMDGVNSTNKILENELSGTTNKPSKFWSSIPIYGKRYLKNYEESRVVKTQDLMKTIIETCNDNTDKVEANMKTLLQSGKDLKKFRESLLDLVELIEAENWTISEIEQVLNVLLGRKNDAQIRETSEFVESFMTDEGQAKERQKLINQIRAIADNAESVYKMMGYGVISLRFVRSELLTTSISAQWVGQPVSLLEQVATDAVRGTKDIAVTGESILLIAKRSVTGMKLALRSLEIIQENGVLSDKGVETIRNLAKELEDETTSLKLLENGNGNKVITNGPVKETPVDSSKEEVKQ